MIKSSILIPALVLAGCGSQDVSLNSRDPGGRIEAAARAAADNDESAIPELIGMLDSDDPAARFIAIGALQRITSQTFGYDYADTELNRREAIGRWVAWYDSRPEAES